MLAGANKLDLVRYVQALYRLGAYKGVIVATTTPENNATTADDFELPLGGLLEVQPDAACYVATGAADDVEAAATDTKLEANGRYPVQLGSGEAYVSFKAVSGTVNVQVRLKAA